MTIIKSFFMVAVVSIILSFFGAYILTLEYSKNEINFAIGCIYFLSLLFANIHIFILFIKYNFFKKLIIIKSFLYAFLLTNIVFVIIYFSFNIQDYGDRQCTSSLVCFIQNIFSLFYLNSTAWFPPLIALNFIKFISRKTVHQNF